MVRRSIFNRACVGKPESGNAIVFLAKTGVMVPGVPYVDGNSGEKNAALLPRDRIRCFTQKVLVVSRLICSSRIQRYRSFSERVGPRLIFLKSSQVSSCWKRSREVTTEHGTDKNRQSMTSCGNCCYYLERSKINHIAIKWTKYENVDGLLASHKIWWSPNKTFGNLN